MVISKEKSTPSKDLEEAYLPRQNVIYESYMFNTCSQQEDQSLQDFFTEVQNLAATCDYGAQRKRLIRDRIVCGIRDDKIREKLLTIDAKKMQLSDLMETCISFHAASKDHTRIKQSMQSAEDAEDVNQCRFEIIYKMLRKITSSQENAQSEISQLKQEVKVLTLRLENATSPQNDAINYEQPECNAVSEMELEAKIQANATSPHNNAINYGQPESNAVSEMELEADLTDARNGWDNKEMTAKVNRISVNSQNKTKKHSIKLRKCYYCGLRHKFGTHICTAFGKTCMKCGKKNHTASVCQSTSEGKNADPDITMILVHYPDTMILLDRSQKQWEVISLNELHINGQHVNARMVLKRLKEFAGPHKKQQTVRIRIGKKNPEYEIRQLEYELTQLTNKFHFHVKQEKLPGSMMEKIYEDLRRLRYQDTSDDECNYDDECSCEEEINYTHWPKHMDPSKDWEGGWKLFKEEFKTFIRKNPSFEYHTQATQCDLLVDAMGQEILENISSPEFDIHEVDLVDLLEWFDNEFTTWKRKKRMTEQKKYRREGMS